MREKQRGVTFIGWVFLLIPFAIVFYAGLRVTPLYLNYMKVSKGLNQLATDFKDASGVNPQGLRGSLEKHFEIDSVDYPSVKDVKVTRVGRGWVVEAAYDDQAPLFANLSIQVTFDKTVRLGAGE
jgi:hypothetical protein